MGKAAGRSVINGVRKTPGKAMRFTGKAIGAAGVATLGIGAGIASGSLDNTMKYGATAAAAGYGVGGRVTKELSKPIDNKLASKDKLVEPKTTYDQAKGENYDAYMENKRVETKQMYRNQLVNSVGEEKADELMKTGGVYDQCIDRGVTNPKDVELIDKFMNEKKVNDIDEAVWTSKAASKITDEKSAKKMERKLAKKVEAANNENNVKMDDSEINKEAKRRVGNAQEYQNQIRTMRQ